MKTTLEKSTTMSRTTSLPGRVVDRLFAAINQTAESSSRLLIKSFGHFESAGQTYTLPRYVYLGPKGGGDPIRIGIFATIHGDEPEGALGLLRLLTLLEKNADVAQGYALFHFPVWISNIVL